MGDLLRSRGFWVVLTTTLTTLAVQIPETAKWVEIALPVLAALASFFGVEVARKNRGLPPSYVAAKRENDALKWLRDCGNKTA